MQEYDKVKVIKERKNYTESNITVGMTGTICQPEIQDLSFLVHFEDKKLEDGYEIIPIKIEDLELVENGFANDKILLDEVPNHDKGWWCKVEDGYILNLKGERKNKIPYKYNS